MMYVNLTNKKKHVVWLFKFIVIMPRVLRIINRFNLGGPTYNATYLSKHLPSEYETLLVGGEKDETEDSSLFIVENQGLKPVIVEEMKRELNPALDYKAYKKIVQIIKDFKPDIVHTHSSKAGAIGRLAAANHGVPVIVHTFHGHVFHSYFSKASTTFYKTVERYLAKKTTKIVAISDIQKHELSSIHKIADADQFEVVPLGFDLSRFKQNRTEKRSAFRKQYQLADDELAVAIVGRLVPIKNHHLFLDAVHSILQKSDKKVRFIIVGDGESRSELEEYAKSLSIEYDTEKSATFSKPLLFTSWIKDVDRVYAGSDIACLTSKNEGTPVSLIEAQAAGVPIVSTNVGGIENVVIRDESALLSDRDEDFAALLQTLIEDDAKRKKMAMKGEEFVMTNFTYKRLVSDMDKLYQKLLSEI